MYGSVDDPLPIAVMIKKISPMRAGDEIGENLVHVQNYNYVYHDTAGVSIP